MGGAGDGHAAQGNSEPFVASLQKKGRRVSNSEVPRQQMEEARILVQSETFPVGQEEAQELSVRRIFLIPVVFCMSMLISGTVHVL